MTEHVLPLDDGQFGIVTLPTQTPRRCGVVLLNAGMIHRIGPFRLHVELARQLALAGYPTLRFDAPGIGDALVRSDSAATTAVARALDRFAERTGTPRFVVGGICSAADLAWKLALTDARVNGVLMLDGLARTGPWFRLGQLLLALQRPPSRWWAMLRNRMQRQGVPAATVADYRHWPAPGAEQAQLAALLDRGVRLLALYTGGAANYFLHQRQFRHTFGDAARNPLVTLAHWRECDHLFFDPAQRQRLARTVLEWLTPIDARPAHG
ncbi:hypothetical protein [Tahibacter amnicola]|uniref:Alpha/beta hydrolase family protein n=1 Tax=Tahibacter amnicola TaxID=2976241 RepID=A0ABY6BB27_9GAMM|nr:hypothetical protein [Tahibacter amnicola]UXI66350.1 hypothetical protein N4264_16525 [Tahibacter amnicola]